MGTINVRLATIRKYCALVAEAEIIDQATLHEIQAIKNKSGKAARNADQEREKLAIPTRRGHKKAAHTEVTTAQVFKLKRTSTKGTGYKGDRISQRAINARVSVLGKQQGIEGLSPHDGRHFWAYDALKNGTPLDKVVSGGGWKSPHMALRYAKRAGIANEGVQISEE